MHKDLAHVNPKRNAKDILDYLEEKNPFSKNTKGLRSLSSGLVAKRSVNVDSAETVGAAILAW